MVHISDCADVTTCRVASSPECRPHQGKQMQFHCGDERLSMVWAIRRHCIASMRLQQSFLAQLCYLGLQSAYLPAIHYLFLIIIRSLLLVKLLFTCPFLCF